MDDFGGLCMLPSSFSKALAPTGSLLSCHDNLKLDSPSQLGKEDGRERTYIVSMPII